MLNLYSIFVYYVFFLSKKNSPTPPHFPAKVGSTPPVCIRACCIAYTLLYGSLCCIVQSTFSLVYFYSPSKKRQVRPINLYRVGKNPKKILFFIFFRALWAQIGWGKRLQGGIFPSLPTLMAAPDMFYYYKYQT